MTDATEAARRILRGISTESTRYRDADTVARALLAGHDETVERCELAVLKAMDAVGRDWKADGVMPKFYAANYLVEHVRGVFRVLRSKP